MPGRGRAGRQVATIPSSRPSDLTAWAGSAVNGASSGPTVPVVTAYVASASPTNSASRAGTWSAALPGVWPGTRMTRGEPGTSRVAPSPNVATSASRGVRSAPCRIEKARNRSSGSDLIRPGPWPGSGPRRGRAQRPARGPGQARSARAGSARRSRCGRCGRGSGRPPGRRRASGPSPPARPGARPSRPGTPASMIVTRPGVLDQVAVDHPVAEPMDPRRDLHRRSPSLSRADRNGRRRR